MRHTIIKEGFGVRLRPVSLEDARFIVWVRGLEHAIGMLGDSAQTVEEQEEWLRKYFDRAGDYYFMVETESAIPLGTVGIYDADTHAAEHGRIVVRPGVSAALPLMVLSYDLAFGLLGLTELRATSVASNVTLHSFIRKLGSDCIETRKSERMINGELTDILHFQLSRAEWIRRRPTMLPLVEYAGKRVIEWEKKYTSPETEMASVWP